MSTRDETHLTDQLIAGIHRNLTEFGYRLSMADAREAAEQAMRGEENGNILALFTRDMLQEHGLIPGE
jgi:hypothetical protein